MHSNSMHETFSLLFQNYCYMEITHVTTNIRLPQNELQGAKLKILIIQTNLF